jgi:hypothetical protein
MGFIVNTNVKIPDLSRGSNSPLISLDAGGFQFAFPLIFIPKKHALRSNLPSLPRAAYSATFNRLYIIN